MTMGCFRKHAYERIAAADYDASRYKEYSWIREYSLIDRLCQE